MSEVRTIAVVTGTRAEYGLLRPVMWAIRDHSALELRVIVAGAHLLPPADTVKEVASEFAITARVPMQSPGRNGRSADAAALGLGVSGFAEVFSIDPPDIVLALGDRIEAFAAAAAASVAGIRIAHMHGGDRAEGCADEALRHAITKLAHIHLPASQTSAMRIIAMGEDPQRVHVVGSPALDGLDAVPPMSDREYESLGQPQIVMLLHPVGDEDQAEHDRAAEVLRRAQGHGRVLAMHPNHDPGRDGIMRAITEGCGRHCAHVPRERFVGLLRRANVLIGNSSAGLIEAAAIPIRCINLGRRQAGREKPCHVIDIPQWNYQTVDEALDEALHEAIRLPRLTGIEHPYGNGTAGARTAEALASLDFDRHPIRKLNTY